jgi:TolA-binding protein
MRRLSPSFDESVSAYREMTALSAEGAATRARVLVRAEREARRRGLARRIAAPVAVGLAILLSGAALIAAGVRWTAPAQVAISEQAAEKVPAPAHRVIRPTRIVPPLRAENLPPAPRGADERLAYERAHRDHFFRDTPAAALAAWDDYLAAYPRGTFAPEARYNRALCLTRLGRFAAAAEALRPFTTERFHGYRRHESCLLLGWLAEKDDAVRLEPSCAERM